MKALALAVFAMFATSAHADQLVGVLVNPYTGYVNAIIVLDGATVQASDLAPCGAGCEFTDFMQHGQCMVVSISRRDASWGYTFGPADDIGNLRSQTHHYCQRYGGKQCKEYAPICG